MINRTMVRTRVIQTLFAYYQDSDKTPGMARQELRKSFADTYDLYVMLLDFANQLTAYAQQRMEEQKARARATHTEWVPNRRFVANRFAQQLFDNRAIRARMLEQHLSWDSGVPAIHAIYDQLVASDFYHQYMNAEQCSYEDDKRLWRKIYQNLLLNSEVLSDALEEMELVLDRANWTVDADVVVSYVLKSFKLFSADASPETPLLEMFDSEEEYRFAIDLLDCSIAHHEEFAQMVSTHLRGWEADRIAYMDRIIVDAALAEIFYFDDIAITVTLNEYIELSKTFSGDKSYMFVNGILTEILRDMRSDGSTFAKALMVK